MKPRHFSWGLAIRLVAGLALMAVLLETLLPAGAFTQPVLGAGRQDWNPKTFWHPNWGASGVHKGIDIFARKGEAVMAAQAGLVLWRGEIEQGGKVILVLTPRGWLHYYAHLKSIHTRPAAWVVAGEPIGEVGDTGNARGGPPHLHYSVLTLLPRPWAVRGGAQGWKAMFYRNPDELLP